MKDWLDTTEYPFEHHFLNVDGHKLHYIDEGVGDVIVFVHGTPSWSFDYRHIIKALRSKFRCVAFDHLGFGLSDKPEHYQYSLANHTKNMAGLIDHLGLTNFHLVVHDFGGPIGLQLAMDRPQHVQKLVILNSWLWSSEGDPDYQKMKRVLKNPLLPFLYKRLNFSPRFILPASFGNKKLNRNIKKQYTKPFQKSPERNGALAFARSLLNDQPYFASLEKQAHKIADKRTLFIWGMKDPVIKPRFLDKFCTLFPNHTVQGLETCGHFPQEEEPEMMAVAMQRFL